jgi:hypothetical protein
MIFLAPITRVARNYILQAASNYEALAYWRNRTQVEVEMFDFIQTNVGQNMHVEIKMIQLLKIELPQKFEDSIINSQVQQQQMQTQEYMQQTTKILLKIKQLYAEAQYNCTLIGTKTFQKWISHNLVNQIRTINTNADIYDYRQFC